MQVQDQYDPEILKTFLILLNPFAPHVSEELNNLLSIDSGKLLLDLNWPKYDDSLIIADTITIAVQINGKTRGTIEIDSNITDKKNIFDIVQNNKRLMKYFLNNKISKEIYIPNRLINYLIE